MLKRLPDAHHVDRVKHQPDFLKFGVGIGKEGVALLFGEDIRGVKVRQAPDDEGAGVRREDGSESGDGQSRCALV